MSKHNFLYSERLLKSLYSDAGRDVSGIAHETDEATEYISVSLVSDAKEHSENLNVLKKWFQNLSSDLNTLRLRKISKLYFVHNDRKQYRVQLKYVQATVRTSHATRAAGDHILGPASHQRATTKLTKPTPAPRQQRVRLADVVREVNELNLEQASDEE
jgi:ribosomal protein L30/L7E